MTEYQKMQDGSEAMMIKNKKLLLWLSVAFLCIMAVLGVLLQTVQASIPVNLRYTAIVLACLFCILFAETSDSYLFTQLALVFTLMADYFLVCRDTVQQLPGMLCFSVVQIAYFMRLYREDKCSTRRKLHLGLRMALSVAVVAVTLAVLGKSCDAVAIVSMFYYANLILNAVFACMDFKKNPIFAIGLILFILCDTIIGLSLIDAYLPISRDSVMYRIIFPGFDLAWAFYLPSQALLAISLLPRRWEST